MATVPNARKGPTPNYVNVAISGGIETKVDANQVAPPNTLVCDNARLTTLGAVRKRYGNSALPSLGNSAPVYVGSTQQQLFTISNNALYPYSAETSAWESGQSVSSNALNVTQVMTAPFVQNNATNPALAVIGNVGLCATSSLLTTSNTCSVTLSCFDTVSGQVYWKRAYQNVNHPTGGVGYFQINGSSVGSAPTISNVYGLQNPQLTVAGSSFVLACIEQTTVTGVSAGGYASFLRIFSFTPNTAAPPDLMGLSNCTQIDCLSVPTYWSAGTHALGSSVYSLACVTGKNATDTIISCIGQNSGDTDAQLVNIRYAGMWDAHTTITTVTGFPSLCGVAMADTLNFAVVTLPGSVGSYFVVPTQSSGNTTAYQVNYTGFSAGNVGAYLVPVTSTSATLSLSNGSAYVGATVSSTGTVTGASSTATTVTPNMLGTSALILTSKIVSYNGAPYAWVQAQAGPYGILNATTPPGTLVTDLDPYGVYFFMNVQTGAIAARAFYLQGVLSQSDQLTPVVTVNGALSTILLQQAQDSADQLVNCAFTQIVAQQPQMIRTPNGAIITGANTRYYDNALVRPAGWMRIPVLSNPLSQSNGGQFVPGSTISYIFMLVDFDSAGNAIYGAPSQAYPICITSAFTNPGVTINLSAFSLPTTGVSASQVLQIYRNSNYDPLSYNLVGSIPAGSIQSSWNDYTADNNTALPELYSQPSGGELPNDPAPPSTCGVATKTRMFLAGAERKSALYFSKPFFYGRAPEFNYGNVLDIEPATGPIVGLAALDENIILFKNSYIYVLTGTGPDATGNGVFNAITNISTDRGLLDPYSIALSNDGVYFRSQRGIELLDRSFNLDYVGQSVETLLQGNTVVSALSVPGQSQVRFALSNGTVLTYDYTAGGWTTYTYAMNSITGAPVTNSMTRFNNVVYLGVNGTSAGNVYAENTSAYLDDAALTPMSVQTAHIPLAGPQGWGRVRRATILGVCESLPCTLAITFIYDYGQVSAPPIYYQLSTPGAFNVRVRAPRQVGEAVSVLVQMSTSSGTGQGAYLTGIMLETSIKSGASRLPDSQSV